MKFKQGRRGEAEVNFISDSWFAISMQQTLENLVGTRRWIVQILGKWKPEDIVVKTASSHILPPEVLEKVPERWKSYMSQIGNSEIGKEGKDWRIIQAQPYSKMEALVNGEWKLRMFAGPVTRIESYTAVDNNLVLRHSPGNYAEGIATNNFDPWGLIMKYGGRNALADGHAVSVAITVMDGNKEVMQYFRRGTGLGEYGGCIGTAAGNSLTPDFTPLDIAVKEAAEESRIISDIASGFKDYGQLGIATTPLETMGLSPTVKFLNKKEKEAYGMLAYASPVLTGLALNIDNEDWDEKDNKKPHHKSEYLFLLRTGIKRKYADDEKFGWTRNDEHAETFYVPLEELPAFAEEEFLEMMPPTNAVILAAIRQLHGHDVFMQTLKKINAEYPMPNDHPMRQAVELGSYNLPELILKS